MIRTALLIAALVVALGAAVISVYSYMEVRAVREDAARLRAAVDGVSIESRVNVLERAVTDVTERQEQQLTGLEGIRSQISAIVGTETGVVPPDLPSLLELRDAIGSNSSDQQWQEVQSQIFSIHSCLRELENAINGGTFANCLLI